MATTTTERTLTLPAVATKPRTGPVRRTAFYLQSQGQPLFAWLHGNPAEVSLEHGVIICAPLGHEQLHAHRGLRHLAEALAGANIPVLRFDWHGTGDSAGIDGDANRCETWQANVRDAAQWMRKELGCKRVSLIGLRIGATLAAASFGEFEIENLVLWSPILKGRAYVREMMAIDLTAESRPKPADASPGDIEAGGFLLSQATAADLSQIDLLDQKIFCQRALIVARDDLSQDHRLCERLTAQGIPVEQISVPGLPEMLAEPHRGEVPERAIQEISAWLISKISTSKQELSKATEWPATSPADSGELELPNELHIAFPGDVVFEHRSETAASAKQLRRPIRERTLKISSAPDLFGILSEPESVSEELPTIVLLNAGASYRVGPGRLHVHMARDFAAQGFRCLRLDLCGLGDSVTANSADENNSYAETAFRDIQLTLRYLRQHLAVQKCVLMGLCSGAYAAFQATAQLSDPILVESVLINPLTFFWKNGMSIDDTPIRELVKQNYYLNAARQPKKWLKLLSGKSQIGLLAAGRMLVQRIAQWTQRQDSTLDAGPFEPSTEPGHPLQDNLPADLARIAAAGRTLAMFFSKADPGYRILTNGAGPQVNALRKSGKLRLEFIDEADHTFSRRVTRSTLIESIASDLCQRYRKDSR